jgi:hypothetical protein
MLGGGFRGSYGGCGSPRRRTKVLAVCHPQCTRQYKDRPIVVRGVNAASRARLRDGSDAMLLRVAYWRLTSHRITSDEWDAHQRE